MTELQTLLKGRKTYIVAALGGLLAGAALLGVPGTESIGGLTSGDAVITGLIALLSTTLRAGLAADK
ncbi:MAG TPA: hypothetical protein VM537_10355 [Anaerolineae bacterium]|nr:hypothetical protein [Anaerolineae bacterium]